MIILFHKILYHKSNIIGGVINHCPFLGIISSSVLSWSRSACIPPIKGCMKASSAEILYFGSSTSIFFKRSMKSSWFWISFFLGFRYSKIASKFSKLKPLFLIIFWLFSWVNVFVPLQNQHPSSEKLSAVSPILIFPIPLHSSHPHPILFSIYRRTPAQRHGNMLTLFQIFQRIRDQEVYLFKRIAYHGGAHIFFPLGHTHKLLGKWANLNKVMPGRSPETRYQFPL